MSTKTRECGIEVVARAIPPDPDRLHALDSLRAAMMLMGVVLHAGLSYSHMPSNPIWPFKDARASYFCDAVMTASGLFRMPAFFMVAGFFAASIFRKRGAKGLLSDRVRRVAIPFAVGWIITFPLVRTGFVLAEAPSLGIGQPLAMLMGSIRSGQILTKVGPLHLWFLEYLLIYYVVVVSIAQVRGRVGRVSRRFWHMMRSRSGAFASLTTVPLLAAPIGVVPTPASFMPEPISLVVHGIFFAYGWTLFGQSSLRAVIMRRAGLRILVAVAFVPLAGLALLYRCRAMPSDWFGPLPPGASASLLRPPHGLWMPPANSLVLGLAFQAALAAISSSIIWLLVMGITGLFFRYLDRPIGWIRYLSGASYWIYLAHFPLTVWLPLAIVGIDFPAEVKLIIVLTVTLLLLLIAYEFGVRGTVIDGRRADDRTGVPRLAYLRQRDPDAEHEAGVLSLKSQPDRCDMRDPQPVTVDA